MPHPDRIHQTYVLSDGSKRGTLWSLWLTPKNTGNNNIFFSSNGYLDHKEMARGHSLHLSIHQNGNSHVRYEKGKKIHQFNRSNDDVFPICSVLTPLSDLAKIQTPWLKQQDLKTVIVKEFNPSDELNWSELAFWHSSHERIKTQNCPYKDSNCNLVEEINIKQNRKIIVLHRYIRKPTLLGFKEVSQMEKPSPNTRITYWAVRGEQKDDVVIYDFSSERLRDGAFTSL